MIKLIKKSTLLITSIGLVLCTTGCPNIFAKPSNDNSDNYFERIYNKDVRGLTEHACIYHCTLNDMMYLAIENRYGLGLVVMQNTDGTPMTYTQFLELSRESEE